MDDALIFHEGVKYTVMFYKDNGGTPYLTYNGVDGGRLNAAVLTGVLVLGNDDRASMWLLSTCPRYEVRRER